MIKFGTRKAGRGRKSRVTTKFPRGTKKLKNFEGTHLCMRTEKWTGIKIKAENVINHIDHNPLNNRKSNLREVTPTENAQNITVQLPKSRTHHRNVTLERGRYRVRINGKSYGCFNSFEEAKIVADREREKVFPLTSKENGKVFINNV